MHLHFSIHYASRWGQQLFIETNHEKFAQIPLHYQADGWWQADLVVAHLPAGLQYNYVLREADGHERREAGKARALSGLKGRVVYLADSWRELHHPDSALLNTAFTEVIFRPGQVRKAKAVRSQKGLAKVRFDFLQVRVPAGLELVVLGDVPELGNWQPAEAQVLAAEHFPLWQTQILLAPGTQFSYKYALRDPETKEIVIWEQGDNRTYTVPAAADMVVKSDAYFRFAAGGWKGMGVAVPVFSLRSAQSCGIGEFMDLIPFVDWAADQGMQLVQILPINDTSSSFTWVDSYPYSAISVFALHPIYLRVDQLEVAPPKAAHQRTRTQLNALAEVDYEAVLQYKLKLARRAYDRQRSKLAKNKAFQSFVADNAHWLPAYAAFCYLRDQHATADWLRWPAADQNYDQERIDALTAPTSAAYTEIAFHYYLQYHLDKQLYAAASYARQRGIILKGDIPIGIDRESADAW
ncbi:MAG: 4-alpha-glucanotransferase, partial [Bacteroidetes bacterium]